MYFAFDGELLTFGRFLSNELLVTDLMSVLELFLILMVCLFCFVFVFQHYGLENFFPSNSLKGTFELNSLA